MSQSAPTFEELFGSCTLQVIAPDTSIAFPEPGAADDWLLALNSSGIERRQAFFGKVEHFIEHSSPESQRNIQTSSYVFS
jgi:hypothetical protein